MKILLATDGSEFSRAALALVRDRYRAQEIHVLHVVDALQLAPRGTGTGVGPSVPADFLGKVEDWLDQAEELVRESAKSLGENGFQVTTSVAEGDPKHEILEFAAKWKPDLIVLGSHGKTGIRRFFLGSVSEAVARHAECSVLIVRLGDQVPKAEPSKG